MSQFFKVHSNSASMVHLFYRSCSHCWLLPSSILYFCTSVDSSYGFTCEYKQLLLLPSLESLLLLTPMLPLFLLLLLLLVFLLTLPQAQLQSLLSPVLFYSEVTALLAILPVDTTPSQQYDLPGTFRP